MTAMQTSCLYPHPCPSTSGRLPLYLWERGVNCEALTGCVKADSWKTFKVHWTSSKGDISVCGNNGDANIMFAPPHLTSPARGEELKTPLYLWERGVNWEPLTGCVKADSWKTFKVHWTSSKGDISVCGNSIDANIMFAPHLTSPTEWGGIKNFGRGELLWSSYGRCKSRILKDI